MDDLTHWVRCPECGYDDVEAVIVGGDRLDLTCRVCDAFSSFLFRRPTAVESDEGDR